MNGGKSKRGGARNAHSQQVTATTSEPTGKNRNLKGVSNIHQLYQDLFITDMKDEIAVASQEVV